MRLYSALRAGSILLALTSFAAAQDKPAPGPVPDRGASLQPQQLAVPPAEKLVLLIRLSLLTLGDAIETGNYTVLRDRGSPAFRKANTAAGLSRIFATLEAQHPDLATVAVLTPQLSVAEITQPQQRLHLQGFFPGPRERINFDLIYEPAEGQWQLFGLSVAATAQPKDAAPAQKATPPKPATKK